MRIEYYSWMPPHIPRIADVPGLEEWPLPTFAQGRLPERLAAQMRPTDKHGKDRKRDADSGWDDEPGALQFVRACPDMVYRAGAFWLIRARFELNPGFLGWTRYDMDDVARIWHEDRNPAWRDLTREDFAEVFGQTWSERDAASQEAFMAHLAQGPLSFWGIPGPLSLLRIARSLERPRFAKIYASDREVAGFLWAEGYPLPDGLDPAECESTDGSWTGWAQIGALVRLQMLPKSGIDIILREDDMPLFGLPSLQPADTNSPATVHMPAGLERPLASAGPIAKPQRAGPLPDGTDASAKVAKFLKQCIQENRRVTAREVEAATGVPEGTVKGLQPWKDYRAHINAGQPRSSDAMRRVRQFAEGAESIIPGKADDPARVAEQREAESLAYRIQKDPDYRGIVERRFLEDENIDRAKKAEYHRKSAAEKEQFLITWKAYGMDD
jgi:hypothetical protein